MNSDDGIRKQSSLSYIPGLDGLRAFAVLAVMVAHFTAPFHARFKTMSPGWEGWTRLVSVGGVGVDIFFVLSGFLIAKILSARPIRDGAGYRAFIVRRAWRLLPVYVTAMLVFTVAALVIKPHSQVLAHSWLAWTMLMNVALQIENFGTILGDDTFSIVHFWSLAAEWHFYLLLPLLLWITRSLGRTAALLIAIALGVRLAFYVLGISYNHAYSFTFARIDSFAFGCLLATPWAARLAGRSRWIALAGAALFAVTMASTASADVLFKKLDWLRTFGYSVIALSIAMMLLGVLNARPGSRLMRILEARPLTAIGRASYSLYVWHLIFFPLVRNWVPLHVSETRLEYFGVLLAEFAVSTVLAILSYRLVETRFAASRPFTRPLVPRPT